MASTGGQSRPLLLLCPFLSLTSLPLFSLIVGAAIVAYVLVGIGFGGSLYRMKAGRKGVVTRGDAIDERVEETANVLKFNKVSVPKIPDMAIALETHLVNGLAFICN